MASATTAILREPQSIVFPIMVSPEGREHLRRIPFQGAVNFRDLGGYATSDGRRTRWGVLYRSDQLSQLNDRDLLYFRQLGLHTVIDFRSDDERERMPDRIPEEDATSLLPLPMIPNDNPEVAKAVSERIENGDIDGLDALALIKADYRRFVTKYTGMYRQFMKTLLRAEGKPVLFHCAAGKDRTGFAAAITLRLLGVPEKTILNDYLLSNEYFLPSYQNQIDQLGKRYGKATADFVTLLAAVNGEYLQSAYQAIGEMYGDFNKFMLEGLALNAEDITRLKAYLLL